VRRLGFRRRGAVPNQVRPLPPREVKLCCFRQTDALGAAMSDRATRARGKSRQERPSPSYVGLTPASPRAQAAARGASRKIDTRPERLLGRALWGQGLRYRKNVAGLPGRPDLVFSRARVAVFCDGDFWHGRDWDARRAILARGANASYWVAKIGRNVERDREHERTLRDEGWTVLRFWEGDIRLDTAGIAERVRMAVAEGLDKAPRNGRK